MAEKVNAALQRLFKLDPRRHPDTPDGGATLAKNDSAMSFARDIDRQVDGGASIILLLPFLGFDS